MRNSGLTLIELVLTFSLLAILATAASYYIGSSVDSVRYESTRTKMEAIRRAILGTTATDNEGKKTSFGFHGDMGRLPAALVDLTTVGSQAEWTYDSTLGIGAGWRGPYYNPGFSAEYDVTKDEWGRAFVLNTGAAPPFLRSNGADAVSGGTGLGTDLVMTFTTDARQAATVQGHLLNGACVETTSTVTLYFATDGAITSSNTATNGSGVFSFTNIPFGPSAVAVLSGTTLGPKPFVIDKANFSVPPFGLMNYSRPAPSYKDAVLADRPVLYLRLGDAGGSATAVNLVESSIPGMTPHGTYKNAPTLGVTGALSPDTDTAVTFDGTSELVSGNRMPTTALSTFTLEAWVNSPIIDNHASDATILGRFSFYALEVDTNGRFRLNDSHGNFKRTTASFTDNTWYHVVGVQSGSDLTSITVYVNGVAQASATTGAWAQTSDHSQLWSVGSKISGTGTASAYFSGTIDEAAIYNYALTSGQILDHYNIAKCFP
jgi:type II secretory pathway pseudopilin PulG